MTASEQELRIAQSISQCASCGLVFALSELKTGCPNCGKNHIRSPPAVLPPEVCCAGCGAKWGDGAFVAVPANLAALVINAGRATERREAMLNELLAKKGDETPKPASENWSDYGISPPLDESTLTPKSPPVSSKRFDLTATPPPPPI